MQVCRPGECGSLALPPSPFIAMMVKFWTHMALKFIEFKCNSYPSLWEAYIKLLLCSKGEKKRPSNGYTESYFSVFLCLKKERGRGR